MLNWLTDHCFRFHVQDVDMLLDELQMIDLERKEVRLTRSMADESTDNNIDAHWLRDAQGLISHPHSCTYRTLHFGGFLSITIFSLNFLNISDLNLLKLTSLLTIIPQKIWPPTTLVHKRVKNEVPVKYTRANKFTENL